MQRNAVIFINSRHVTFCHRRISFLPSAKVLDLNVENIFTFNLEYKATKLVFLFDVIHLRNESVQCRRMDTEIQTKKPLKYKKRTTDLKS